MYDVLVALSYRIPKWEARIKYGVTLVPTHVRTLASNLKHKPVCQGNPKYVLSDSGLEIKLAIPFVRNFGPEDDRQQAQFYDFVHYYLSE
ncbi:uncharacterized protein TNCV_3138901 [Trichonephila clavipes]|nr:uncharacterized protein TNCV_3138901 [Trichonephila clavipes]